jgi:hypothetical protein
VRKPQQSQLEPIGRLTLRWWNHSQDWGNSTTFLWIRQEVRSDGGILKCAERCMAVYTDSMVAGAHE